MKLTDREKKALKPLKNILDDWKIMRVRLDSIEYHLGSRKSHSPTEDAQLVAAFDLIRRVLNVEIGGVRGDIERVVGLETGGVWR